MLEFSIRHLYESALSSHLVIFHVHNDYWTWVLLSNFLGQMLEGD